MASIFTDGFGGLRTNFYTANYTAFSSATSVAPYVFTILQAQADKFFIQNYTNAILVVLLTCPNPNQGNRPVITTPQQFVQIQPGTAFNLDNALPTKISVPAGTTISIYCIGTPTSGGVDLFTAS